MFYESDEIYESYDEVDRSYRSRPLNDIVREVFNDARSRKSNIDKEEIDTKNENGNTPLMIAVYKRDLGTCQFLLDYGADPNVLRSRSSMSTALSLAKKLYNTQFIRMLIRHGAHFSCSQGLEVLEKAISCGMYHDIAAGEAKRCQKKKSREEMLTAINVASQHGRDDLVALLIRNNVSLGFSLLQADSPELIRKLISAGVDVNIADLEGRTSLHKAAESMRFDIVQILVDAKANIEALDREGNTPFLLSTPMGKDIMTYLIEKQCNINCVNLHGQTPLFKVVKAGSIEQVKELILKGANINITKSSGQNALHMSIKKDKLEVAEFLIDKNINVNSLTSDNISALILAIDKTSDRLVHLLIKSGADVNCVDGRRNSALIKAISYNYKLLRNETEKLKYAIIAEALIEAGANVDSVDISSISALILALENGNIHLAKLLIGRGCNVNVRNKEMLTALMIAVEKNDKVLIEMMLQSGANVNDTDPDGNTALMRTVAKEEYVVLNSSPGLFFYRSVSITVRRGVRDCDALVIVEMLVKYNADVNVLNKGNDSALNIAIRRSTEDVAKLLVKNGADVNCLGSLCEAPLLIAAENMFCGLIQEIVQTALDVNVIDDSGSTALMKVLRGSCLFGLGVNSEYFRTIRCLIQCGSNVELRNKHKLCALSLAVETKDHKVVEYLLEHGANVNQLNESEDPMLFSAVETNEETMVATFLKSGAKVNTVGKNARTALMVSLLSLEIEGSPFTDVTKEGSLFKIIKLLVDSGADINARSESNETPIVLAAYYNQLTILNYLLENGADINCLGYCECLNYSLKKQEIPGTRDFIQSTDPLYGTYSHYSTQHTWIPTSLNVYKTSSGEEFLDRKLLAFKSIGYHTPLQVALLMEHKEMVHYLLQAGADIFRLDLQANETIHYVSSCINTQFLIHFLSKFKTNDVGQSKSNQSPRRKKLKLNFDLNRKNKRNETALFIAVKCCRKSNVKSLIQAGSDINSRSLNNETVLSAALRLGFDEIALLLMQNGSELSNINNKSQNAFQLAVQHRCSTSFQWIMERGANIFERNTDGGTVLHYSPSIEIAKRLIKAGLSVNDRDRYGRSPLHIAIRKRNLDLASYLLEQGANVNSQTCFGNTPLILAVKFSTIPLIKMLHEKGADVNKQNKLGYSPLIVLSKKFDFNNIDDRLVLYEILALEPNLNIRDNIGRTALMLLAHNFSLSVYDLIAKGANVNLVDREKRSTLVYLLMNTSNYTEVETFIERGKSELVLNKKYISLLDDFVLQKKRDDRNVSLNIESLRLFLCNGFAYNLDMFDLDCCNVMTFIKLSQVNAIRMLISTCYLSNDDLRIIMSFTRYVPMFVRPDLSKLLTQASKSPWPLVKLAFIAVSSQLGDSPEREQLLEQSNIPETIQELLRFQTKLARLPLSSWEHTPLVFDPVQYEKRPIPRPLLYYWPIGENIFQRQKTKVMEVDLSIKGL